MKTQHNNELLLHNLPDYISESISDKELVSEIEREIEINPDFKFEYEEMKKAFVFLNYATLENPQENYFSNLSVRINEKLSSSNVRESFWERLGIIWKILIPVIPIAIIAMILYISLYSNSAENKITEVDTWKTEPFEKNIQKEEDKSSVSFNKEMTKVSNEKSISKVMGQKFKANEMFDNPQKDTDSENHFDYRLSEQISELIADKGMFSPFLLADNTDISDIADTDSEEDVMFTKEDEEDFEEEILQFTPEEQREILDNLSKSQI